jgi:hypothetical protein
MFTIERTRRDAPASSGHVDGYSKRTELKRGAHFIGASAARASFTGERDARAFASIGKARIRVRACQASPYGTPGAWRLSLDVGWKDRGNLSGAGSLGGRTAWIGWRLRGGVMRHPECGGDDWTGAPSWKIGNLSIGWFTRNGNAVPYVG